MDLHAQNVLSPQIEKQKQLDSIVDKRINEERERQMQEELRRKKIKEEVSLTIHLKHVLTPLF